MLFRHRRKTQDIPKEEFYEDVPPEEYEYEEAEEEPLYEEAPVPDEPEESGAEEYYSGRHLYGEEVERGARAFLEGEPLEYEEEEGEAETEIPPTHPAKRRRRSETLDDGLPAKPRKPHKKKHYFLKFLGCLALAGLVGLFMMSGFFAVDTIEVEGNVNYKTEEVIKLSGLKKGTNLWKIRKGEMRDKLLGDSYIDSAKITREPPRKVVITIEERTELAAIKKGKKWIVIDREGYMLRESNKTPRLTQITGVTITKFEKGKKIQVKETDTLADTLVLLDAMSDGDLFFKKVKVEEHQIKVFVYDHLICRGTPEDVMANIENGNLEKILYDLTEKDITKGTIIVSQSEYCSFSPEIE